MSGRHQLLAASAGTGKTYRLATHFAALLAAGEPPERILATTFTRKAAGEILERVFERLVEATEEGSRGERARAELATTYAALACGARPAGDAFERGRLVARTAALARAIGRFRVETLDAFFVALARSFAFELALAPEWRIAGDGEDADVRAEILAGLMEHPDAACRAMLLRSAVELETQVTTEAQLHRMLAAGLALHREAQPGAWEMIAPRDHPSEEALARATRCIVELELPKKQTKNADGEREPPKNWVSWHAKAQQAIASEDWSTWLGLTLVKKVLAGDSHFDRFPIAPELAHAVRVVSERAAAALLDRLIASNRARARWLDAYVAAERAVRDRRGIYRFETFPLALQDGPGGSLDAEARAAWLADVGFRLDARIDHLLLDEFQDTSPLQWRLLLPLAEELFATYDEGDVRSFFCVGDVKQSIYGWRGAEPRLFGEMGTRHAMLAPEPMCESWRSSPVVLDTVNRVFEEVAKSALLASVEGTSSAAERWNAGFEAHRRAAGAGDCPGVARFLQAEKGAGSPADACLALAVQRVEAIVDAAPAATVAVLLRANRHIAALLFLLQRRGIAASGEGGNPLTDAPAVAQALALLHLADHPADRIAALSVAHSPFGSRYGLLEAEVGSDSGSRAAEDAARRIRRELVAHGYGTFFAELGRACFDESTSDWDRVRFDQLCELALEFDARAGLRPTAFATLVREQRVESPNAARVRVMTVHAAKGLEFDAVVLPDLSHYFDRGNDDLLYLRDSPLEPIRFLSAPKSALHGFCGLLEEAAKAGSARALTEELSVLYVAMTRAVHQLEMIAPPPPKREDPKACLHLLLREALTLASPSDASRPWPAGDVSATLLWEHPENDESWLARKGALSEEAPAPEPASARLAAAPRPRTEARRSPSSAEPRARDARALLAAPAREARAAGALVHVLFEELEWAESEARDDSELAGVLRARGAGRASADEAVALYRSALAHPAISAALARPTLAPGERAIVLAERPFDVELGAGAASEVWAGSIDRLVLIERDGKVERAEVVDFKTDRVDADDAASRATVYEAQLAAYRRVVAELHELPLERVRATLLFVVPGVRVALFEGTAG